MTVKKATLRTFTLSSDINVERFIGEATYSVVATYEKGIPGEPQSASSLGIGQQLESKGRSSTRIFQAARRDSSIRSRGGDPRCLLYETAGSGRRGGLDVKRVIDAELRAAASLEAEWKRRLDSQQPEGGLFGAFFSSLSASPPPRPFPVLLGELLVATTEERSPPSSSEEEEEERALQPLKLPRVDAEDWVDQLGTPPPRPGARWLVYEYDGLNTISSFSIPTQERIRSMQRVRERLGGGFGLPPLPEEVPWQTTATFVLRGAMKKSLEALALLHESGLAHRSLCSEAFILTAESQDKGTALQRCDPDLLVVKLGILGFSSPLSDASRDRLASAAQWLPKRSSRTPDARASSSSSYSTLELTSVSLAEDLHALGLTFLALLLGALAEPNPSATTAGAAAGAGPSGEGDERQVVAPLKVRDLERLLDGAFGPSGDDPALGFASGGLSQYLAADPQRERAVNLLEANDRCGWKFLGELITARQALRDRAKFSVPSARALVDHPFMKA